jgi:serine/threonine protein kinase
MGVVYRATQLTLERVVALKLLSTDLGDDAGFRTRFQREGQLQAGLDHEHIVPVYEAGQSEHGLFLAMRLIDGPTLKDLILTGVLDPRRSIRLLGQVAHALDAAHRAGLIHRDIKPQNILIGKGDHAFLADFGLIKAPDEAARLTGTGQFIGTIDYVAPEQVQGDPASAVSDVYALTGVLYECLTGEVPFPRPNEAATLHSHVVQPPPRVSERRPDLPAALDEVIARGMAKDPAARPASASEVIMAAARALASAPAQALSSPPSTDHPAAAGAVEGQTTRLRATAPTSSTPALERRDDGAANRQAATVLSSAPAPERSARAPDLDPEASTPQLEPPARDLEHLELVEPEQELAPAERRSLTAGPVVLASLAAAAVVAGFLIGHSSVRGVLDGFTNSAAVNRLQLRYPSTWELSSALSVVPGMSFAEPLVLTRTPSTRGLTAGMVSDASGPTLLSPSFRARLIGGLPPGDPVRLGATQAYRYIGLRIRGLAGALTLYTAPTSAGVATIACWSATGVDRAFQADCGRVAATLRLVGASSYPLGPSPQYAQLLSTTFQQLRSAVRAPLARLKGRSRGSDRASSEQQLAGAYAGAAGSLASVAVSPVVRDVNGAMVAALRRCADGYARAAAATTSGGGAAYTGAAAEIQAASTAMNGALQGLASLGYTLGGQR